MALRLVLFDFDDTLFDHKGTVEAAFVKMRDRHPFLRAKPLATTIEVYHESLETMHPDILAGRMTVEEGRAKRFHDVARHCGTTITDQEALALAKEYRSLYCEVEMASEGAIELLSYCKEKFTVGVVTNNIRIEQETRAKNLGIDGYIDYMVTFEDAQAMKPDPAMLRKALKIGQASNEETVLIGDSLATDVEAALQADMRCLWLCSDADYEKKGRPVLPNVWRVERLADCIPILDRMHRS